MSDSVIPRTQVNMIIRPVDEVCNLACTYCNAAKYTGEYQKMTLDVAEKIIRDASAIEYSFIQFCWHGGEPLLAGLEFYKEIVRLQTRYFGGVFKHRRMENVIQTNALMLSGEYADFLAENKFNVGISLDGPDAMSNRYRFPVAQSKGILDKTLRNAANWKALGNKLVFIIVLHDANIDRPTDLYNFFREFGADTISFNARFLRGDHTNNASPEGVANFLKTVVQLRNKDLRDGNNALSLGVIDELIRAAAGREPATCFLNGKCNHFININRVGDVFASCTDELGVKLGDIGDLSFLVQQSLGREHPEVTEILGKKKFIFAEKKIGPGCPKRSNGNGDEYFEILESVV